MIYRADGRDLSRENMHNKEERQYPEHGTRIRYRRLNCRCVACTRQPHGKGMPDQLMWPYAHLERKIGSERVSMWYDDATINKWRSIGLDDYEADRVAIQFGTMAHAVWPGWTVAGEDADVYP